MAARKATAKANAKETTAETKVQKTVSAREAEKPAAKAEEKTAGEKKIKAETKTAEKRAVKAASAKKAEVKEKVYLQFMGREICTDDIMKKVKENWTKVLKNKVGDMKSVTLSVKPEEGKAYFVINDDVTGSVEL